MTKNRHYDVDSIIIIFLGAIVETIIGLTLYVGVLCFYIK